MDPITLGIIGALGAAGLFAFLRRKPNEQGTPPPACDSQAALEGVAGETVSGAAAGVPIGGTGAAAGAGLGLALGLTNTFTGPCGSKWIDHARGQLKTITQTPCAKADQIYAKLRQAGGNIPGYANMSCEQKLAATVALATTGGPAFAAALAVAVGVGAVTAGTETAVDNVTHTNTTVGTHGTSVGGHRIF
jgi:hypothetical protein